MDTINLIETIATMVCIAGILLIIALWFRSRRAEELDTKRSYAERVRAWWHLIAQRLGHRSGEMPPSEIIPAEELRTERSRRQRSRSEPLVETPHVEKAHPRKAPTTRREAEKHAAEKPGLEKAHASELEVLDKPVERPRPDRSRPERPPAKRMLAEEPVITKPAARKRPANRPRPDKPHEEEQHRASEEATAPPPKHTPREQPPRVLPATEQPRLHIEFTLGLIAQSSRTRRVMWITLMNRGPSPVEVTGLDLQAGNRRQGFFLLELDDPDHYALPVVLNPGERTEYVVTGYDFDELMYHVINKQTWFVRSRAIRSIRLLVATSAGKQFIVKPHKKLRKYIASLAMR